MNLHKFLTVVGLFLILTAGFQARRAFAQDPEEPLLPVVLPDLDTASTSDSTALATFAAPELLRPPVSGGNGDATSQITIGQNKVVSAPQSIFPAGLVGRSETAVSANEDESDNPVGQNVVIGWNDADGFLPQFALDGNSGWAFSSNFGSSFADGGGLPPGTIPTSPPTTITPAGDPWLELWRDSTGDGKFLYANLAVRASVPGNGPGTPHSTEGVTIHLGTVANGAITWGTPALIPSPSAPNTFGLDKEAITVDRRTGSKDIYVSATNFDVNGSNIVVFHSSDGATTFSGPTLVQGPGVDGVQGSMPAVGTNGEVYVVWERGRFNIPPAKARIQFARSTDQGATFSPAVDVALITAATRKPPAGYNRSRYNDFPRIAVALNGPNKGRIYVVYQDAGNNPDVPGTVTLTPGTQALPGVADADVFLKYSDNGGATWSAPVNINGAVGDGKVQFWPVVSIGAGGEVDVTYHEDVETNTTPSLVDFETVRGIDGPPGSVRRSTRTTLVNTFLAVSQNGGVTFGSPVKISDVTSNWSLTASNIRPNYGDYIASVSREIGANTTRVFATWADGRASVNFGAPLGIRPVPSVAYASVDVVRSQPLASVGTSEIPKSFALDQNYPNPFNPSTRIDYRLPEAAKVELRVYNILGQEVKTLVDNEQTAGAHQIVWDGRDGSGKAVSSGIYFYKLKTPNSVETKRMMLVK